MSDISRSAIHETPELIEALKNASHEEMKVLLANASVEQGLTRRDIFDENVLIPTTPGRAPQKYAKAITDNQGRKLIFEGDSELEMEKSIGDYFRAQHLAPAATNDAPARDAETGRFTAQGKTDESREQVAVDAAAKADLLQKFQLGLIDASTYLEQSGAVAEYLEKAGVPLEDLREAATERQSERIVKSWQQATDEFIQRTPDWVGGQENTRLVGEVLQQMGATEEPSVENIEIAVNWLRENGKLVENPEVAAHQRIADSRSFEEIRQIGSSLFGRN